MADGISRAGPATGEVCPTLADDLLRGADEIAKFVFGSAKHRRKVYYYASAKLRMPTFRIGAIICARRSTLLQWIEQQERMP
ncbi:DNA-binding protein [Pseudorhodoplanes sp.]|uniref:DNA-binding protein n=1 Tax=Pseudorhodoplanes sp. TaxID=1934341 RepID=UPI003919C1AC